MMKKTDWLTTDQAYWVVLDAELTYCPDVD